MNVSILLLDCSKELEEKLKRQGFDVASACVGYAQFRRPLPAPVYEYEVIIYNPGTAIELTRDYHNLLHDHVLQDFDPLLDHLKRGAIVLIFINAFTDDLSLLNEAYSWVPNMPEIAVTRDFKPVVITPVNLLFSPQSKRDAFEEVTPLLQVDNLKLPVRHKIVLNSDFSEAVPLFRNRQHDVLGLSLKISGGRIIVLPEHKDNEDLIGNFLTRVLPRLRSGPIRRDIVDSFVSPMERTAKQEMQDVESERQTLDQRLEKAQEQLAFGGRSKRKTIESDETAARIISYYNTATQQEDVALFYLYKIIDAIENKFGGATAAKQRVGNDDDWRLIGKIANASYGDIRHAPKPGEIIKPWTKEEIDDCFGAAKRILKAYFTTLF